jgi:heptaprenyl diphosphate synthase
MEKILKGELDQMATRYQTQITINDYLKQVSGKTGQLFALSCFVGAYESGGTTNFAKTAEKIGMNIGIAFQLLDDILDYTSDGETLGNRFTKMCAAASTQHHSFWPCSAIAKPFCRC